MDGAEGRDGHNHQGDNADDGGKGVVTLAGSADGVVPHAQAPDEDASGWEARQNQTHAHPGGGAQKGRVRSTEGYWIVALNVGVLNLAGELRVGLAGVVSDCVGVIAHGGVFLSFSRS